MNFNHLWLLFLGWMVGVIIGGQLVESTGISTPSIISILGFVGLAAFFSVFFFGKLTVLFILLLGIIQSPIIVEFPVAGALWGLGMVGAALQGKTLGMLALEDFFENAKTRLPGYAVAAMVNLLLILGFVLLIALLWDFLPDKTELKQLLPLQGLGV